MLLSRIISARLGHFFNSSSRDSSRKVGTARELSVHDFSFSFYNLVGTARELSVSGYFLNLIINIIFNEK